MNFESAGAALPPLPLPKIIHSINCYLHPTIPTASLRYILHGGSGSEEDQFMIGFSWLATETVVMMIVVLFAVLYACLSPDVVSITFTKFLHGTALRCSPELKRDLEENSAYNGYPNGPAESRFENRPTDLENSPLVEEGCQER